MQGVLIKREKVILCVTIGIVIFSIGFNLLIAPLLKKNDSLNKEINITRIKLSKYTKLLSQKEYIQDRYQKFSSNFNISASSQDNIISVLSELENLAKEANIRIIDIRPQSTKKFDLYKEILIDVRTEGAIEGYLKFIYGIENSLFILRIKRLQLNTKPNTSTLEGIFSLSQLSVLD